MGRKSTTITIIFMLLSITTGLMSHDLLIGGLALFTALMCSYFSSEGKRVSYIYGLINYLLIGLISFKNHLYGLFFFGMIVCPIIQIQGYISWGKNLDENKNVKVREFTLRNSFIITISCILGSLIISSY